MSSIAIMQPYFFPYLGYFQLISAVDCFVFYDDTQYIEHGWSNRNRILLQGESRYLTVPVGRGPIGTSYLDRHYLPRDKVRPTIRACYGRAPQFQATYALVERVMAFPDRNVAKFNEHLLRSVAAALGIETRFFRASEIDYDRTLDAQGKVIDICRRLEATHYINASGGKGLYDKAVFAASGLKLHFHHADLRPYEQFGGDFIAGLSIIDVLMFNEPDRVRSMLNDYKLSHAE